MKHSLKALTKALNDAQAIRKEHWERGDKAAYDEVEAEIADLVEGIQRLSAPEPTAAVPETGPAEFKPSGIQCTYRKSEGVYYMDIYDKNDKRVAYGEFAPVRLQQFGVDLLQQTTYRFTDTQSDLVELQHRMDGLEK